MFPTSFCLVNLNSIGFYVNYGLSMLVTVGSLTYTISAPFWLFSKAEGSCIFGEYWALVDCLHSLLWMCRHTQRFVTLLPVNLKPGKSLKMYNLSQFIPISSWNQLRILHCIASVMFDFKCVNSVRETPDPVKTKRRARNWVIVWQLLLFRCSYTHPYSFLHLCKSIAINVSFERKIQWTLLEMICL